MVFMFYYGVVIPSCLSSFPLEPNKHKDMNWNIFTGLSVKVWARETLLDLAF